MTVYIQSSPEFDAAAGEEAWEWLNDNAARYANAVRAEVDRNRSESQIYRYVLALVGEHRRALAMRCKLAAMHLIAEKAGDNA